MAIGGVVIQFLAKTRDAIRDVDALTSSVEDTGDSGRDAARDLDLTERSVRDVATEAEQAARRIRQADLGRGVREGADDINTAAGHIKADLGEAGRESGAEFIGNIAEGIGSGQAKLTDVVSGTLGGLTNLAATLTGPVGLAAGAAAAGIGLVFAAIQGQSEKAKAKIDELRGALEDLDDLAGKTAREAVFKAWISSAQATTGKIENTRDVLNFAKVDAQDFQKALAGDPKALEKVTKALETQGTKLEEAVATGQVLTDEQRKYMTNWQDVLGDIEASDEAVGAVRREHSAIEELMGKQKTKQDKTNASIRQGEADAQKLKRALDDAADDRKVKITMQAYDSRGRLVNLPPPGSYTGGYAAGPSSSGLVTEDQIYLAVEDLILRGRRRHGGRPMRLLG